MAISVSYTTIPSSDVDPDSPITTGLMTAIVNNITFVKEWLGKDYTAGAAENHDHDGVNSKLLPASIFGNLFAFQNYH